MRTTLSLILVAAVACAAFVTTAPAQSSRTEAEMRAGPRDVREIFLTLPYPAHPEPDSIGEDYADYMDTFDKRLALLERPYVKPGEYENVIDTADGYLRLNLTNNWGEYVTVAYFTRADGSRLVVLQLANENHVEYDPHTEDYFYTLGADGRYTEVEAADVLPPITFEDFWGEQQQPPAPVRRMFAEGHLYNIEWPRRGTVAVVRSYPPFNTYETVRAADRRAKATYGQRRFATMELVWDRGRGLFRKGEKTRHTGPDKTWTKGPSLPSLCAKDEFDMFNCPINGNGKFLSICASEVSELERGRGYIQYRFGRPGRVELEFPRERRGSARSFTLDYDESYNPAGPVRRSSSGALTFINGGYRYTVRETFQMGERPEEAEKDGWVEVLPVSESNGANSSPRVFRCLEPVQGTLGNLRRYIPPSHGG